MCHTLFRLLFERCTCSVFSLCVCVNVWSVFVSIAIAFEWTVFQSKVLLWLAVVVTVSIFFSLLCHCFNSRWRETQFIIRACSRWTAQSICLPVSLFVNFKCFIPCNWCDILPFWWELAFFGLVLFSLDMKVGWHSWTRVYLCVLLWDTIKLKTLFKPSNLKTFVMWPQSLFVHLLENRLNISISSFYMYEGKKCVQMLSSYALTNSMPMNMKHVFSMKWKKRNIYAHIHGLDFIIKIYSNGWHRHFI